MSLWAGAIKSVVDLISEAVEDPDKRNEINLKLKEVDLKASQSLLDSKTSPKVDAFVKILIAIKDVLIPLMRPLGAACMTAFGMYCHLKGIPMEGALHAVMDGAFPAWGASRHVEKQKKIEKETEEEHYFG